MMSIQQYTIYLFPNRRKHIMGKFVLGLLTIPAAYMVGKIVGFNGALLYEEYKKRTNQQQLNKKETLGFLFYFVFLKVYIISIDKANHDINRRKQS